MELPVAPVGRIIKNAGATRVSSDAEKALAKILDEKGIEIASKAIKYAKHSGREDINANDMTQAIQYNNCNITHLHGQNVSIDQNVEIHTFNELYKKIDEEKYSDEVKEIVKLIENELNKETVDKKQIKNSINFLKNNAVGIVGIITPLIVKAFGA